MNQGRDHGQRRIWYNSSVLGTVVGVHAIGRDRRLYVDVVPHDNRGVMFRVPVVHSPGFTRQLRPKMTVLVDYPGGDPQHPVVIGHNFNSEAEESAYHDPLPDPLANVDDLVVHHDETGAFIRFRSDASSATTSAPDGSSGTFEATLSSGATLELHDYPASDAGTRPTEARATLSLPGGCSLVVDARSGGTTVAISHPSGASVTIDTGGTVTASSPSKALLVAPDVELGADGGQTLAFFAELQRLTQAYATHTHLGVTTGMGVSGPPAKSPPQPVGTKNTRAV